MNETPIEVRYPSAADLEAALRDAAIAHGRHEQEIGHADPEWPSWYANHMWSAGAQAARPA